jgi:adenylosuccinate synthase
MGNIVVVGVQWGDEGKGKIVDFLAQDADIVARYQGGANAGHTIIWQGREFVLHLVPCGILYPKKICVLGNGVVIDPKALLDEVEFLKENGISVDGRLFISDTAHITLPYHKRMDGAREQIRKLGTTKRGIGPTYVDKMGRIGIRTSDLINFEVFREKLKSNSEEKNIILRELFGENGWDWESTLEDFKGYGERIQPWVRDTSLLINEGLNEGKRILFEGAQGTLLDIDFGTYPYVTTSSVVAGGVCTGLGIGPTKIDQVMGVAKAYTTRVGEGPFPTEFAPDLDERMRILGREYGATTGRPRRCGWFDTLIVRKAVRLSGIDSLAISKLDVLDELNRVKICVGYRYHGEILTEFPNQTEILSDCEPVYEEIEGWEKETRKVEKVEDLPRKAREYLDRIGEGLGVKISIISVGPKREDTIVMKDFSW